MTSKFRDQRASVWEQMKATMDLARSEGRDLSGEEETTYARQEVELDKLDAAIAREEKFDARESAYSAVNLEGVIAPDGSHEEREEGVTYDKAFASYLARGMSRMSADEQNALQAGFRADDKISNALSVGTNSAGGYLVPPGYREEFIIQMKAYGNVQDVATVINTDSGQPLQWPRV